MMRIFFKVEELSRIKSVAQVYPHASLMMRCARPALEFVQGAAVGAQRFAGFLDGQVDARVRVPQQHVRHRAVQRQVGRTHFDAALLVFLELAHGASQMWVSQS